MGLGSRLGFALSARYAWYVVVLYDYPDGLHTVRLHPLRRYIVLR